MGGRNSPSQESRRSPGFLGWSGLTLCLALKTEKMPSGVGRQETFAPVDQSLNTEHRRRAVKFSTDKHDFSVFIWISFQIKNVYFCVTEQLRGGRGRHQSVLDLQTLEIWFLVQVRSELVSYEADCFLFSFSSMLKEFKCWSFGWK